jgi:tetratricopeptide (TPR) repeat protein
MPAPANAPKTTLAHAPAALSAPQGQLKPTHFNYENLDRIEVLASLCVERGNYAKAKESATHGIAIYRELNCHDSDELAALYTLQGLASAKLQNWDELAGLVEEAESLSDLSPSRRAELYGLKALLNLHLNDKQEAKANFQKAVQAGSTSIVAAKAIEMYRGWPGN